jgi:CRP-like cAMP-binding protein
MRCHRDDAAQSRQTILDCLASIRLFDGLSPQERETVARHVILSEVAEGEIVFEEGKPGNYMCFVAKGLLAVLKDSPDKTDCAEICVAGPGSSLGEMAVIENRPRSATVAARKDTVLVTLTRESFHSLLDRHPHIGIRILKSIATALSSNLRETSHVLVAHMLPML